MEHPAGRDLRDDAQTGAHQGPRGRFLPVGLAPDDGSRLSDLAAGPVSGHWGFSRLVSSSRGFPPSRMNSTAVVGIKQTQFCGAGQE
jgi:hypothetical protein